MKYESELIKEIVDSRGHKKSSIHYESECVETWINEAKGAYPKLCDYQSEWLEYISILDDTGGGEDPEPPIGGGEEPEPEEPPIGEFPYETVTANNTATVNHVVPLAYKSVILKGDTLVNVVSEQGFGGTSTLYESRFVGFRFNTAETFTIFVVNPNVTSIKVGLFETATGEWKREEQYIVNNNKRVVYTVPANYYCTYVGVQVNTANDATGFENSLVIVSGDKSNLEIENYFEGMQSVKMPVLTITGKNLNSANNEDVKPYGINDNGTIASAGGDKHCEKFIKVPPSSKIFLSFGENTYIKVLGYDKNKNLTRKIIRADRTFTFQTNAVEHYIRLSWNPKDTSDITKLSLSLSDYEYQPYQSNILTVNEDVTLRSNGDICDELNLLTGKLTQRIDVVVLDGSEEWVADNDRFTLKGIENLLANRWNLTLSDKYPAYSSLQSITQYPSYIIGNGWSQCIHIRDVALFPNPKNQLSEFKEYLSQNPVTVHYQTSTESIKTVDLSVVNQDGEPLSKIKPIEGTMHIEVSGTPINPTAVLEVPVEAITQNLNSFIGEE